MARNDHDTWKHGSKFSLMSGLLILHCCISFEAEIYSQRQLEWPKHSLPPCHLGEMDDPLRMLSLMPEEGIQSMQPRCWRWRPLVSHLPKCKQPLWSLQLVRVKLNLSPPPHPGSNCYRQEWRKGQKCGSQLCHVSHGNFLLTCLISDLNLISSAPSLHTLSPPAVEILGRQLLYLRGSRKSIRVYSS